MPVATTADLIIMFPELASADSGTLQLYLDDAEDVIESEGIASSHVAFSRLQRYKTASLLSGTGYMATDNISESVADVSITKGGSGFSNDATYSNKYERLYQEGKANILGLKCKLY